MLSETSVSASRTLGTKQEATPEKSATDEYVQHFTVSKFSTHLSGFLNKPPGGGGIGGDNGIGGSGGSGIDGNDGGDYGPVIGQDDYDDCMSNAECRECWMDEYCDVEPLMG